MIDSKKDEVLKEVTSSIDVPSDLLTIPIDGICDPESNVFASYDALSSICEENAKFYENEENECGQRYHGAFSGIIDHIVVARKLVNEINQFAHQYDFDENTPGNGYRSFVKAVRLCVEHSVKVGKHIGHTRTFIWFRKNMYMK